MISAGPRQVAKWHPQLVINLCTHLLSINLKQRLNTLGEKAEKKKRSMCGSSRSFLTVIQFSSQTAILFTAKQNPCHSTITTDKFKLLMACISSDVSPRKRCAPRKLSAWPVTHLGTEHIWVCCAPNMSIQATNPLPDLPSHLPPNRPPDPEDEANSDLNSSTHHNACFRSVLFFT